MSKECNTLHKWFNGMKKHSFPFNEQELPENGIYILFEKGEFAHGTNRIVRIGTHTGDNNLRARLKEHFINEVKDRSIFRKNIGRCILNKTHDPFLKDWNLTPLIKKVKLAHPDIDYEKQQKVEKQVSKYIQENFTFAVFRVDSRKKRLQIESKLISTVSLCEECKPSKKWLGNFSPKEKIQESGLWLVNELWKTPLADEDMIKLKQIIDIG